MKIKEHANGMITYTPDKVKDVEFEVTEHEGGLIYTPKAGEKKAPKKAKKAQDK